MSKLDFRDAYPRLTKSLKWSRDIDRAMADAVGGEFEAVGVLELETLKYFGLKEDSYVIDVGCGSGRLAKPLSRYLTGRYLGIDIAPTLVGYARRIAGRDDWRFEVAEGLSIPEEDGAADVVCFFSVLTHLLHEQSYVYLREAERVLKPGGKVVFSFLDFTVRDHWVVFEGNIRDLAAHSKPLNMFVSKDTIRVWAERLGLQIQAVEDDDKPFVPLSEPIVFESGLVMEGVAAFGQSVCGLQKGVL
ncbi:MAG: class I SAM-dependent methyltransferase [Pyrinomonadaceae bacterium]